MRPPIDLTFLAADRPLSKSYSLDSQGQLQKSSYPSAYEFTSQRVQVSSMREFAEVMLQHAARGNCLLKGNVSRPLVTESRAGSTDPNAPTEWICLDIDRLRSVKTLDQALGLLALGDHSYLAQYSASYGIEKDRGLTAHAMLRLNKPVLPSQLKQWLMWKNLTTPALEAELTLTKTNMAVAWGLDITTCQNDKLIYIAPPQLGPGVEAPEIERIAYVERGTEYVDLDAEFAAMPSAAELKNMMEAKINALRKAKGLDARKFIFKTDKNSGLEVLAKCDAATLSGIQRRDRFVYLNLNNGDSWGYWHAIDAPGVIRNWKGEPDYLTKELLPDYWAQLQRENNVAEREARAVEHERIERTKAQREAILNPSTAGGNEPILLVFRDFESDTYWNGVWNPETQELVLAQAGGIAQLQHWLLGHGQPKIDHIPVWKIVYDPHSDVRVDLCGRRINLWAPTKYMKQAVPADTVTPAQFPIIWRVLNHAISSDAKTVDHWLNWATVLFRERICIGTAWTYTGIPGTGKGLIFNKILMPLLGADNCAMKRTQELEDTFNGWLENKLLVAVDEADVGESKLAKMITANLKNLITEPHISVRRMHSTARMVPNFSNWMFNSNEVTPVVLDSSDRRHNIGEFQRVAIEMSQDDIDAIEGELEAFANFLHQYNMDVERARRVLHTADRQRLIETSRTTAELVTDALQQGQLELFWDALPTNKSDAIDILTDQSYIDIVHSAVFDGKTKFSRDELHTMYVYLCGRDSVPRTGTKFTQMLRHRGVALRNVRMGTRVVRGLELKWNVTQEWIEERRAEVQAPITPLVAKKAA
jgi:hypothetical protein